MVGITPQISGAIPLCLMWTIRRERNQWTFEGVERSNVELKRIFLLSLYEWMVALSALFFFFFRSFLIYVFFVEFFVASLVHFL